MRRFFILAMVLALAPGLQSASAATPLSKPPVKFKHHIPPKAPQTPALGCFCKWTTLDDPLNDPRRICPIPGYPACGHICVPNPVTHLCDE